MLIIVAHVAVPAHLMKVVQMGEYINFLHNFNSHISSLFRVCKSPACSSGKLGDNNNCGSCGNKCSSGKICSNG